MYGLVDVHGRQQDRRCGQERAASLGSRVPEERSRSLINLTEELSQGPPSARRRHATRGCERVRETPDGFEIAFTR